MSAFDLFKWTSICELSYEHVFITDLELFNLPRVLNLTHSTKLPEKKIDNQQLSMRTFPSFAVRPRLKFFIPVFGLSIIGWLAVSLWFSNISCLVLFMSFSTPFEEKKSFSTEQSSYITFRSINVDVLMVCFDLLRWPLMSLLLLSTLDRPWSSLSIKVCLASASPAMWAPRFFLARKCCWFSCDSAPAESSSNLAAIPSVPCHYWTGTWSRLPSPPVFRVSLYGAPDL